MERKISMILPEFIEPNGRVKKFLAVARDPKVQREYEELLKDMEVKPSEVGRKLREVKWGKKSVDEIVEELESG